MVATKIASQPFVTSSTSATAALTTSALPAASAHATSTSATSTLTTSTPATTSAHVTSTNDIGGNPDGDDGDFDCASAACESERDSDDEDAPRLYGASGRNSLKRMQVELDVRASLRARRPTHAQYAAALLDPEAIKAIVTGEHRCCNTWLDNGEEVQCHHQLWARGIPAAVAALAQQRESFLAGGTKDRGDAVYAALTFQDALQLHGPSGWSPPVRKVVLRVGLTPGSERVVCREIFLAHYPVSLSTLKRIVARKRLGAELYVKLNPLLQQHRISNKTCHVLSWWLEYAKQVRC